MLGIGLVPWFGWSSPGRVIRGTRARPAARETSPRRARPRTTLRKFDWAAPDDEVHAFVNELERAIGTYLYGRRMYETMRFWETVGTGGGQPAAVEEFAQIWRAAQKIVYSRTLQTVSSARTSIERDFEPAAIRRLKASAGRDISVGGAGLAGQAIAAGLVDECHLFLGPVVVGGGKRALPDNVRARLELLDERRFDSGVVYLRYRMAV
jgi:dihydrofolate reductase